jgi:hypothetical protein
VVIVATAGLHEAHLPGGARLLFRAQGCRNSECRLQWPSGCRAALLRGGTGPGVVTLAWLRAAGRAGCGAARVPRRESPGALPVLPVTGLRAGRRRAPLLAL